MYRYITILILNLSFLIGIDNINAQEKSDLYISLTTSYPKKLQEIHKLTQALIQVPAQEPYITSYIYVSYFLAKKQGLLIKATRLDEWAGDFIEWGKSKKELSDKCYVLKQACRKLSKLKSYSKEDIKYYKYLYEKSNRYRKYIGVIEIPLRKEAKAELDERRLSEYKLHIDKYKSIMNNHYLSHKTKREKIVYKKTQKIKMYGAKMTEELRELIRQNKQIDNVGKRIDLLSLLDNILLNSDYDNFINASNKWILYFHGKYPEKEKQMKLCIANVSSNMLSIKESNDLKLLIKMINFDLDTLE